MLIELTDDFAGGFDSRDYRLVDQRTGASYGTHLVSMFQGTREGGVRFESIPMEDG